MNSNVTLLIISLITGYLPNSNLAVEAMLATSSIGATWSSTSPDFGVTVSNWYTKQYTDYFIKRRQIYNTL